MSSPNAAPGGSPARPAFSQAVLVIDPAATAERIERAIQAYVRDVRRRGAVVAVSGGVDSAVVLGLCARALGPERVLALLMPERDSSADSVDLGRRVAARFGTPVVIEELTPVLAAAGCYERQAAAIRLLFPDYADTWRSKITLPSILDGERLNMPLLTVETPAGERLTKRLTAAAYLQLVAATNFKQRVRKMMEYYHADRLHYVVAGTPNRLEYDQGFFVKQGDGAADLKPIAHLYKTQVYQLAAWLEVPEAIRRRPPTTDTFSLAQTQEEFYFAVPYDVMDLCLYGLNHGVPAAEVAAATNLTAEQVERVYRDIEQKRRTTRYLHAAPALVEPIPEVGEPCAE
ncbi:MAG TPA: NAD(+) synthase [Vicinamibacterales bacterium]|nr:NAD(+) synthase [Vicinamibacterales bacterium]